MQDTICTTQNIFNENVLFAQILVTEKPLGKNQKAIYTIDFELNFNKIVHFTVSFCDLTAQYKYCVFVWTTLNERACRSK